ncbi:hypothetical protein [Sorangium sp. So ce1024]|uniref:hypothetical protein n=1 Tax=Sorangium sp. So ce1024 TaxID=3133327 RepID=UPI003F08BB6A
MNPALDAWHRNLIGRRLVLRHNVKTETFALGSLRGARVEVCVYVRGSHANGLHTGEVRFVWSPREVCRRMVTAKGRQEIEEPQEAAGAGA